jgi:nucleoid-associated protein YgaU
MCIQNSWAMRLLVYTVQPEDRVRGLDGLAQWFYGEAARWVELYRLNQPVIGDDPLALSPGQQLILAYDTSSPLQVALYHVQQDDFRLGLAGIALRAYGDPGMAAEIYRVNRGTIGENPDVLQAGQVLILP